MISLIGKSLAALKGKENPGLITTNGVIPVEPSLATEGMLWFDNLMVPDSTWILPFALSGIVYATYAYPAGNIEDTPLPWATLDFAHRLESENLRMIKYKKFASLAIVPATLMFPSAMLLYWFTSALATLLLSYRHKLWGIVDEDKPKSKPPAEKYYPPTGKQMRKQKMNKK